MGVSGYTGNEVVRTSTSVLVGSSGEIKIEAGGELVGLTRDINFNLLDGRIASASGGLGTIITSGLNPRVMPINGTTDPTQAITWTSAVGTTTPVFFPSVPLPDDFDKAVPALVRLYGEGGSANATNGLAVGVFFGVGGVNAGSTMKFTSAPSVVSMALTTANQTSAGPLTLMLSPQAHASGPITLYGAKITYKARARAT